MAPQSPTRQNSGGQEKYYRRGEIGSRQRLRTAVQGPKGAAQSTPDWQDLGLGNNRQIHKDPSWATKSNLAQHRQTGVKTIKTRPEAMQAHENSAAQPTSTIPVERTAVGKCRHVGTMQGDFPLTHCPVHVSAGSSLKSSTNGKSRLGRASGARRQRAGS